jgi:hypothetical protein
VLATPKKIYNWIDIELAAVMAIDKVSRKAAKASKAFSNFI